MSKESTPVFESHAPQPEQRQPENKNLPKNSEKLTLVSEQAKSINIFKMAGFSEAITKENFPDATEGDIEMAVFYADTTKAGLWMQDAKTTKDPDLQKMMQRRADKIMKQRDKRMKEYLEKTDGKLESDTPANASKDKTIIPQQKKPQIDDHMYL